jgi:hypothetical protein
MITSILQGGLGNQMFQIAAAHSLSIEINSTSIFDFSQCSTPGQGHTSIKYVNSFFKKINNSRLNLNEFTLYYEPKFSYDKLPLTDNICLFGYFQSEKYFSNYKNEIIDLFHFKDDIKEEVDLFIENIKNNEKLTVVHVRRGDYLNKLDFHAPCNINYYQSAMNKIGEGNFVFVSDDINWCKENFKNHNIFFSDFNSEIHDLYLITKCDNIIMSNSSFSWWGVYMNSIKNIVISPSVWFGPSGPQDTQDIYSNNWIKI